MLYVILTATFLAIFGAVYAYVASKLSERKSRIKQEELAPKNFGGNVDGQKFNIQLTSGIAFNNVAILGAIECADGDCLFVDWDGVLVIKNISDKKVYIKKSSIDYIEEL